MRTALGILAILGGGLLIGWGSSWLPPEPFGSLEAIGRAFGNGSLVICLAGGIAVLIGVALATGGKGLRDADHVTTEREPPRP